MHFLALVGLALFAVSMLSNAHTPSLQFLLCCVAAMADLGSRVTSLESRTALAGGSNEVHGKDE